MKLFVLILNRTEKLDDLMMTFVKEGICGATILESTGMARELYHSKHDEEEVNFLGSIRSYLNGDENKKSKTILTVIRDDQEDTIVRITEEIVGDFSEPDTGIMFSLPLDFVRGKGLEK
jgi:hypothetical protein